MKKQIFYFASAALIAGLAACSSDELEGTSIALKKGELVATIQQSTSTRVNVDGLKLYWATGDAIGVYSEEGKENQEYDLSDADNGKFKVKNGGTAIDEPKYAYYPFEEGSKSISKNGNISLELKGSSTTDAIDYSEDNAVKMPMVGQVNDNGQIAFHNTTALLKVTVVNMPADKQYAILTNKGSKPICGSATVNIKDDEPTLEIDAADNVGKTSIYIKGSSKFTQYGTYTFYYVIPAGAYSNGLTFALGGSNGTADTGDKTYSAKLTEAQANYIYEKTLYYNESGDIVTGVIAELNDKLAEVTAESHAVKQDLNGLTTGGTVYVPAVASNDAENQLDELTLTLENLGTGTITLKADPAAGESALTPKKVIVKTSQNATDNADLVVNLPNSEVELAPANETVTLSSVTFTTGNNVLRVDKGVSITTLTRTTSGDVYVEKEASIPAISDADFTIYKEEGATITGTYSSAKVVGSEIYDLAHLTTNAKIKITDASDKYTFPATVNIDKAGVEIDLNGKTLSGYASGVTFNVTGSLTIVDSTITGEGEETPGSITVTNSSNELISVAKGASLTVKNGVTLSNSSNTVVAATDGTITLKAATITGNITLAKGEEGNGATAHIATATGDAATVTGKITATNSTLNIGAAAITATDAIDATGSEVNVTGAAAISGTVKAATSSTLTINNADAAITGDVTLTASSATVTAKSITGAITESQAASLTLNEGKVVGGVTVTGVANAAETAQTKLIVNGGSIEQATGSAITAATEGIVEINGGSVKSAGTSADAIAVTEGKVTVKGGEISGTKSAVNVTKGSLTVTGSKDIKLTATNADVIASSPANDYEASITLDADKAYYNGANVINNKTDGKVAKLAISAGYFSGEISTGDTYFISGGYFKDCTLTFVANKAAYLVYGYELSSATNDEGYAKVTKIAGTVE
jgi:hypothetical protein